MHDLEQLNYLLGIKVEFSDKGISLSQETYINNLLSKFEMTTCNGSPTPAIKLLVKGGTDIIIPVPYRKAVGALIYLQTATRPDISFAVNQVSRFMHDPKHEHWLGVKQIFRYLQKTKQHKLWYLYESESILTRYSDASFASDTDTRRSISRYAFTKQ